MKKLGFIGVGNMANAILGGVLGANLLSADDIMLSSPSIDNNSVWAQQGICVTRDNGQVADGCDIVVLAVKPQKYDGVLAEIAPYVFGKTVVSIAPGFSLAYLEKALSGASLIRVMPNTPLLVGKGATTIAPGGNVPAETFALVQSIFSAAGVVAVVEEKGIDLSMGLSGSTPAFFFRMVDALVNYAVANGVEREVALTLAAHTLEGAGRLLVTTGAQPETLIKQVCSPGGTTLAALSAFDDLNFEGMMDEALERCAKRGKELGK